MAVGREPNFASPLVVDEDMVVVLQVRTREMGQGGRDDGTGSTVRSAYGVPLACLNAIYAPPASQGEWLGCIVLQALADR